MGRVRPHSQLFSSPQMSLMPIHVHCRVLEGEMPEADPLPEPQLGCLGGCVLVLTASINFELKPGSSTCEAAAPEKQRIPKLVGQNLPQPLVPTVTGVHVVRGGMLTGVLLRFGMLARAGLLDNAAVFLPGLPLPQLTAD